MRLLITGAGGMVGKNLLEHQDIGAFDILAPSRKELDLSNFAAVQAYLSEHRPDVIVHAAGKVGGIQANLREPVAFLLENLDIGRNIVWASRQVGVRRLINLGSSCMYPRNYSDQLSEDLILKGELEPTNEGYALAKIVTARLCEYVSREDGAFKYKTLIPCNLFGRHDKFDPEHSHLIPAVIHKIHQAKISGIDTVEIWGDGKARREFLCAAELADAIVKAINQFESLPNVMNIGLGYDYSITEYYDAVKDVVGYKGRFVHNVNKPVGMARKLASINRQLDWGWRSQQDLRAGLEETYAFYLKEYAK